MNNAKYAAEGGENFWTSIYDVFGNFRNLEHWGILGNWETLETFGYIGDIGNIEILENENLGLILFSEFQNFGEGNTSPVPRPLKMAKNQFLKWEKV